MPPTLVRFLLTLVLRPAGRDQPVPSKGS
jgi:hypothetical protein